LLAFASSEFAVATIFCSRTDRSRICSAVFTAPGVSKVIHHSKSLRESRHVPGVKDPSGKSSTLSSSLVFSLAVLPRGPLPLFGAPETFWRLEVALFSIISSPVEGEDVEEKLRVFISPIGRAEGSAPELPVGKNVVKNEEFSGENGWSRVTTLPPTTRGFHRRKELLALFGRSKALIGQYCKRGKDCTALHCTGITYLAIVVWLWIL
jgi:hypothetical protein